MDYIIERLTTKHFKRAHEFQCEYLDKEGYTAFCSRVRKNPDFYLVAISSNEIAGLCYGEPSDSTKSAVHLQGIAVNLDESKDFTRKGIGSALLKAFENIAIHKGYSIVGVGAADDSKVESFYIKNGYIPYELVAKDGCGFEYARETINDYLSGKDLQKKLYDKYNPREVIFIFKKKLI